jgi:hypothetical protein
VTQSELAAESRREVDAARPLFENSLIQVASRCVHERKPPQVEGLLFKRKRCIESPESLCLGKFADAGWPAVLGGGGSHAMKVWHWIERIAHWIGLFLAIVAIVAVGVIIGRPSEKSGNQPSFTGAEQQQKRLVVFLDGTWGVFGLTSRATDADVRSNSCSTSSFFGASSTVRTVKPVTLPPGRSEIDAAFRKLIELRARRAPCQRRPVSR